MVLHYAYEMLSCCLFDRSMVHSMEYFEGLVHDYCMPIAKTLDIP